MSKSLHQRGTQGLMLRRWPCNLNPRIDSSPARYIQPAEPVYHVQPPRPVCGGTAYTSPTAAYGSTLYLCNPARVDEWLIGLSSVKSSPARSPSPSNA